jgi:hypothetical protein
MGMIMMKENFKNNVLPENEQAHNFTRSNLHSVKKNY